MPPSNSGPVLAVSAHAADYLALAAQQGREAHVLCLSFGERGESARLWKEGKKLDEVKAVRRAEAERAAEALGAQVSFLDAGDYPLVVTPELLDAVVQQMRAIRPAVVLTHSATDPYNVDHPRAAD